MATRVNKKSTIGVSSSLFTSSRRSLAMDMVPAACWLLLVLAAQASMVVTSTPGGLAAASAQVPAEEHRYMPAAGAGRPSAARAPAAVVAQTPPMGFNSYDSYDWTMNETQLFSSAAAMASRLRGSGYDTITLDWYWYRDGRQMTRTLPKVGLPTNSSCQIFFDEGGRMYPDPHRFPSTAKCKCWTPITTRLRAMGISLGLHLMPGASKFAVDAGYRVPGTQVRLSDVVDWTRQSHGGAICPGCTFYQLNMSKPGAQAWYDAYYAQLAGWGIQFIKADFLPAEADSDNIKAMASAITKSGGGMVLSIHGVTSPEEAAAIGPYVNMYRITSDVHDNWGAERSGFAASMEYGGHGLEGAPGLNGRSWPNHDMLPLGYQKPPSGSPWARVNGLSLDEQQTLMTLWGITRSPLIYGGRLDNMTSQTVAVLTKAEVLRLSQHATKPPRALLPPPPLRYQGLGYTMAPCNASDLRQHWTASMLPSSPKPFNGSAVNLHKTFDKNGTAQQVCMRLMVYKDNCENKNWTKLDLMDCGISHCGGDSIRWQLPTVGAVGTITSALTGHCLTPDPDKAQLSAQPCLGSGAPGQSWQVASVAGAADTVTLKDTASGKCLAETTPNTPSQIADTWVGEVGALTYAALFNTADYNKTMAVSLEALGVDGRSCRVREVWDHPGKVVSSGGSLRTEVAMHGVALLEIDCGT